MAVVSDALKKYVRKPDKDLNSLMKYAKILRIEKVLRNYLEVLLWFISVDISQSVCYLCNNMVFSL